MLIRVASLAILDQVSFFPLKASMKLGLQASRSPSKQHKAKGQISKIQSGQATLLRRMDDQQDGPNSRVCPFNLQETRFPSTRPLLPSASQSPCRRYQRTSSQDPMHCSPQAPCSRDSLGENTGVGCRALLLDPGIEARSPDCRRVLYRPRHQGSATETPQAHSTRTGEHAAG